MKIALISISLMILCLQPVSFAKNSKMRFKVLMPAHVAGSVYLQSGAQQIKYYSVEKGSPLIFTIKGPTTLKIRTRAEYKHDDTELEYECQVWEDGNIVANRKVKASITKVTLPGLKVGIYNARDIMLKVPAGKHRYRLVLISDEIERYFTRFYKAAQPIAQ